METAHSGVADLCDSIVHRSTLQIHFSLNQTSSHLNEMFLDNMRFFVCMHWRVYFCRHCWPLIQWTPFWSIITEASASFSADMRTTKPILLLIRYAFANDASDKTIIWSVDKSVVASWGPCDLVSHMRAMVFSIDLYCWTDTIPRPGAVSWRAAHSSAV